jgi:hypothetical protein
MQQLDQFFVGASVSCSRAASPSFVMKNEHDFIRLKDVGGTYAASQIVDTFQDGARTSPFTI